jgi:uncharacterized membrane protein
MVRFLKHVLAMPGSVRRAFPPDVMGTIEGAIVQSERRHSGEIRFAVEAALDPLAVLRGVSARERALEVFSELRVWDTEANNGVLIYLLLADRDVEIVADRGIDRQAGPGEWEAICRAMEAHLAAGRLGEGVLSGIDRVGRLLESHFPSRPGDRNELANEPARL